MSASTNVSNLIPVLEHLQARAGRYVGRGTNFQGHPFEAALNLTPKISGTVIEIEFLAKDATSAFHEELTWITTDLLTDRVCLYTVSTNTPGVLTHALAEDKHDDIRERRLAFRLGDPANKHSFRQEVTIDLMKNGDIEYRYAWGVPHEDFGIRVHAVLHPASVTA